MIFFVFSGEIGEVVSSVWFGFWDLRGCGVNFVF